MTAHRWYTLRCDSCPKPTTFTAENVSASMTRAKAMTYGWTYREVEGPGRNGVDTCGECAQAEQLEQLRASVQP